MFEDFLWALWLAAAGIYPLGFMLGSSCSPCCGGCGISDGKPRTDPKDEGTWTPSGTWTGVGGVTWTFTANPGDESGETWFFYGSSTTSKVGGGATTAEQRDWGNICNWYSNKTTSPSSTSSLTTVLNKRATRLPPATAVVHIYSGLDTTTVGPQTVKNAYFWGFSSVGLSSQIASTDAAHDSPGGFVFNDSTTNLGVLSGGATFNESSINGTSSSLFGSPSDWVVNDGAVLTGSSINYGTVNGGARFYGTARNSGVFSRMGAVNGGAEFYDTSFNASGVNDGAEFFDSASNTTLGGLIDGGAVFNDTSYNDNGATVDGGATFYNTSYNLGTVNDSATFNDSSFNRRISFPSQFGTVNGGATFNDAACSQRFIGLFANTPCNRQFVAHPTDLPTCNGTAPDGCANAADTCGCG